MSGESLAVYDLGRRVTNIACGRRGKRTSNFNILGLAILDSKRWPGAGGVSRDFLTLGLTTYHKGLISRHQGDVLTSRQIISAPSIDPQNAPESTQMDPDLLCIFHTLPPSSCDVFSPYLNITGITLNLHRSRLGDT